MMLSLDWRQEAILRPHERRARSRERSSENLCRRATTVPPNDPKRVLGYYTLGPGAIEFARVRHVVRKGLGRYEAPVFRLARLAVDKSIQSRWLGGPC